METKTAEAAKELEQLKEQLKTASQNEMAQLKEALTKAEEKMVSSTLVALSVSFVDKSVAAT